MGRAETVHDCKNELVEICAAVMALKSIADKYQFGAVADPGAIVKAQGLLRDLSTIFTAIDDAESFFNKAVELSRDFEDAYLSGGGLEKNEEIGSWPGYLYRFSMGRNNNPNAWDGSAPFAGLKLSNWLDKSFRGSHQALEAAVGRYTRFANLPGVYISS